MVLIDKCNIWYSCRHTMNVNLKIWNNDIFMFKAFIRTNALSECNQHEYWVLYLYCKRGHQKCIVLWKMKSKALKFCDKTSSLTWAHIHFLDLLYTKPFDASLTKLYFWCIDSVIKSPEVVLLMLSEHFQSNTTNTSDIKTLI